MTPNPSIVSCEAALARAEAVFAALIERRVRRDKTVHRSDFEAAARVVIVARSDLRTARESAGKLRRRRP